MATLSRKTILAAIDCLEKWSNTTLDTFVYELEISEKSWFGDSKRRKLFNLFRLLEEQEDDQEILRIISEALPRLHHDNRIWLTESLAKDGFVVGDRTITPDVPIAEENRTALEMLIKRHAHDLDAKTLSHHLENTLGLFKDGKWDSSIGQARNFVEQLLGDIAKAIAKRRNETPDIRRPVQIRQYLLNMGFFDKSEKEKLVDGVYGYFSEEGSHPGISEQSAARVSMHILWAFSYYILEKFEDWKSKNGLS